MALTDQQKADVRRFAGYPQVPSDLSTTGNRDFAYGWVLPGTMRTLADLLDTLTAENETTLTGVYLAKLYTLEAAIVGAGDNLDTDQAAVWTRNRSEVQDRTKLFNQWRRAMCDFLGIPAGPSLGQAGARIVRG